MKIKKTNLVSREDLVNLVRSLKLNIWALENGRVNDSIISLKALKENIEANLREDCDRIVLNAIEK